MPRPSLAVRLAALVPLIASVGQRVGLGMGPDTLIEDKQTHRRLLGQLGKEHRFEGRLVVCPPLKGSVSARPLAAKARRERQFCERTAPRTSQQGIEEFELGLAFFGEDFFVDGLTKSAESVKLAHGIHWLCRYIQYLP